MAYTENSVNNVAQATSVDNLNNALNLIKLGLYVFPLQTNKKTPAIQGGCTKASNKEEDVRRWFSAPILRTHNIGIKCENIYVIDVDVKNGKNGLLDLAAMEAVLGPLSRKCVVRTQSGGIQLYFKRPAGEFLGQTGIEFNGKKTAIDIRVGNQYAVAVGSVVNDKPYEWETGPVSVDELDELPQAWKDYLPKKNTDNKSTVNVKDSCEDKSVDKDLSFTSDYDISSIKRDTLVKRTVAFVACKDPAIEGQHGQAQMWDVINDIFNGLTLTKEEGMPILLEYNARCCPPWDMSNPADAKWINYAVDRAIATPIDKGKLLREYNKQSNEGKLNEEFVQFEPGKKNEGELIDDEKRAREVEAMSFVDEDKYRKTQHVLDDIIAHVPRKSLLSLMSQYSISTGAIFPSIFNTLQALPAYTRRYTAFKKYCSVLMDSEDDGLWKYIVPNLYQFVFAMPGVGKSEDLIPNKSAMECLGKNRCMGHEPGSSAVEYHIFKNHPIQFFIQDEASCVLEAILFDKKGNFSSTIRYDLDMYMKGFVKNYRFAETVTMLEKGHDCLVDYPFKSKLMVTTIESIKKLLAESNGSKLFDNGFMRRVCISFAYKNRDILKQGSSDDRRKRNGKKGSKAQQYKLSKEIIEILEKWKKHLIPDDMINSRSLDAKGNPVDNWTELLPNRAADDAYYAIEKYSFDLVEKFHKAQNYVGEGFCNGMTDLIARFAMLFAFNRCVNPDTFESLYIKRIDFRNAFVYVTQYLLPNLLELAYGTNSDEYIDKAEDLLKRIDEYLKGKIGDSVSSNRICGFLTNSKGKPLHSKQLATNYPLLYLVSNGFLEKIDETKIGGKITYKYARTWYRADHKVNYIDSKEYQDLLTMLEDYSQDDEIPEGMEFPNVDEVIVSDGNETTWQASSDYVDDLTVKSTREQDETKQSEETADTKNESVGDVETNVIDEVFSDPDQVDTCFTPPPSESLEEAPGVCAGKLEATQVKNCVLYKNKFQIEHKNGGTFDFKISYEPRSLDGYILVDGKKTSMESEPYRLLLRFFNTFNLSMELDEFELAYSNVFKDYSTDKPASAMLNKTNEKLCGSGISLHMVKTNGDSYRVKIKFEEIEDDDINIKRLVA